MLDDLLNACAQALESDGNPLTPEWFVSQMEEQRLWRASEDEVRRALLEDSAMVRRAKSSNRLNRS